MTEYIKKNTRPGFLWAFVLVIIGGLIGQISLAVADVIWVHNQDGTGNKKIYATEGAMHVRLCAETDGGCPASPVVQMIPYGGSNAVRPASDGGDWPIGPGSTGIPIRPADDAGTWQTDPAVRPAADAGIWQTDPAVRPADDAGTWATIPQSGDGGVPYSIGQGQGSTGTVYDLPLTEDGGQVRSSIENDIANPIPINSVGPDGGSPRGYISATNSYRTEEIDSLDQKYVSQTCHDYDPGDCAADACSDTYHCYIDMHGYTDLACQVTWAAGSGGSTLSVTIRATIQDDGTAAASCTYQDITSTLFTQAAATETDMLIDPDSDLSGLMHYIDVQAEIGESTDGDTSLYVWCKKAALR